MSNHYDVIIIGGGNAGFGVSALVHDAGKSIAFIEERDFGGNCPNRGCTPKKVLVAAAHALHEIETASTHGITVGPAKLDWGKLIRREKDMSGFIPDAMEGVAKKRGDVFKGSTKFVGPNSVEVDGTVLTGEHIVIATGSKPRPLPIPGAELMITSDEVLSSERQPSQVIFIGGGVIAMEFSHVYARAGTDVTILEVIPRLLPNIEADAVAALRAESERVGVTVKTSDSVTSIAQANGRLEVTYEHDGETHTTQADTVINGAGRVANVDTLDLDAANVRHDGLRIETDEFLRSASNPAVWVTGDTLTSSAHLFPLATHEGWNVGRNIVDGPSSTPDYAVIPSAVHTVPALATLGLTEEAANEKGLNVKVSTSDMTGWFSAKSYAESVAWAKALVDQDTDRIVGAHMVSHRAEELIHLFAMAMRHDIPASAIKDDMFAFPTFSSDVKNLF